MAALTCEEGRMENFRKRWINVAFTALDIKLLCLQQNDCETHLRFNRYLPSDFPWFLEFICIWFVKYWDIAKYILRGVAFADNHLSFYSSFHFTNLSITNICDFEDNAKIFIYIEYLMEILSGPLL